MNYKIILAIFLLIVMLCFDMNLNIEHFMSRFQNKQKQKPILFPIVQRKVDKKELQPREYDTITDNVAAVAKKLEKRSKTVILLSKIFINILLNY